MKKKGGNGIVTVAAFHRNPAIKLRMARENWSNNSVFDKKIRWHAKQQCILPCHKSNRP